MNQGAIKFFSARKGFGFVAADEGGKEVFLPATALGEVKAAQLIPGQRVAFKTVPDAKGPKVTELRLLDKPAPVAVAPTPAVVAAAQGVTVYCDPASEAAEEVLDAIAEVGISAQVLDVTTTPMTQDGLKRLSLLLGEAGQSLVRRFDSLFLALQLDDRFIGEADFWMGIIEHPVLINSPIVVLSGKACICKSAKDAKAFIGGGGVSAVEKPKTLSPRLAALLRGEPLPPPQVPDKPEKVARTPVQAPDEEPQPVKKAARPAAPKAKASKAPVPAKKAKSAAPVAKKKKAAAPPKPAARKAAAKKPVKRAKK